MGKRINIELPKYRVQMHIKLVRRRKPLVSDPILPKPATVKRKFRTGTFPGRLARYFAEHKNIRKVMVGNFAAITIMGAFLPQTTHLQAQDAESVVIEAQTNLVTEKNMLYPVTPIKINQGYNIFHRALDLGGKTGTTVKPVASGIIAYAGWSNSGYGNLVILQQKNGFESYYAHLSKIYVKTGQSVDAETILGLMGATGHATGPHLHLEIRQRGTFLNPLTVLSQ